MKHKRLWLVSITAVLLAACHVESAQPSLWTPTGDWIVFSCSTPWEKSELYLVRPDGSALHLLFANGALNTGAVWSPDGEWIAFTSAFKESTFFAYRKGDADVYRIRPDGSALQQLTDSHKDERFQDWSPTDRNQIIITQTRTRPSGIGSTNDLFALDLSTGNWRQITFDAFVYDAKFSPDGTRIAYARGDGLHLISAEGADKRSMLIGDTVFAPAWSPDMTRMLVILGELRIVNLDRLTLPGDSTQLRLLTQEMKITLLGGSASWSPDGEWVVFAHDNTLYKIRPDGSDLQDIVEAPNCLAGSPHWYAFGQVPSSGAVPEVTPTPPAP
ncbi:MAG: hypothetical protein DYG88_07965 [Chloroflexi bacterium CFX4]|nr:hypothetical protein [Chloroflexi bacterium CFX4]MDL1921259.1 hypothetical protein [Chloroflexi bacterium CFX3]